MRLLGCALFLLHFIALSGQSTRDSIADSTDSSFYFSSSVYPIQTARIELTHPIKLYSFEIEISGKGVGTFDIDIYGHEGGAAWPLIGKKLTSVKTFRKGTQASQKFLCILEEPLIFRNDYFFLQILNMSDDMGFSCNSNGIVQCKPPPQGIPSAPLILKDLEEDYEYKWVNPRIKLNYDSLPSSKSIFKEHLVINTFPNFSPNQSISWEDVNGDSLIDLLVGNYLWINQFGDFGQSQKIDVNSKRSAFIDFDNDRDPDILFFGNEGISLYLNIEGEFVFDKMLESVPLVNPSSICVADINNDKLPDIFIAQLWSKYPKPLPNYLLLNNKDSLIDVSSALYPEHDGINNFPNNVELVFDEETYDDSPNINLNRRSRAAQFIDYDQDGDEDLYVANYFLEGDEFFENTGDLSFTLKMTPIDSLLRESPKYHENYFGHGTGISWTDYDNDGDFDYILSQLTHPQNIQTFGHLGTTFFENVDNDWISRSDNAGIEYEESHAGVSFGDLNNDGLEDLIIASFYDCRYMDVYIQNKDHTYELKTFESGLNKISDVHDISIVDFNNDGKLDVCFIDNGSIRIFENQLNEDNNWLKVRLQGISINSYGIGAIVRVFCGNMTYTKHLSSGKGQSMQSPMILHFGLSKHDKVDKIEVLWSSDKKQTFRDLNINQTIEIVESSP